LGAPDKILLRRSILSGAPKLKYVGSSVDLRRRVLEYYNVKRLLNEESMPINAALLKYGNRIFSFTILEICDRDILMSREKHFF
jgi:group I intron endonuclease